MDRPVPTIRRLYRTAWCSTAVALTVLGVAGGILWLGTSGALFLLGVSTLLTGLGTQQLNPPTGRPRPIAWHVSVGLLAGTTVLAVAGLTAVLGAAGWWLSVLMAAAGWPVLRHPNPTRARTARPPARRHAVATSQVPQVPAVEMLPAQPLPEAPALLSVSTAQLCWAWRVSYVRVNRSRGGSELDHLARLRRGYLDELQRRDPATFDRWFTTARAASDPARFFCRPPTAITTARPGTPEPQRAMHPPTSPQSAWPTTGRPGGPNEPREHFTAPPS